MRVSIVQMNATEDKRVNLAKMESYIRKASNSCADLILFPEFTMAYIDIASGSKLSELAEPLDGPFVSKVKKLAKQYNIYVVFGLYEKHTHHKKVYNSVIVIDKKGEIKASYRKTHLCDAWQVKESDTFIPGTNSFVSVQTDKGKIGIVICYELRFPEVARYLATKKEVDFILVSAAWYGGILKEEQWEVLLKARAIENTVYICAVNQSHNLFSGRSMIVDPMGFVVTSLGESEGLALADLSHDRIKEVRKRNPSLSHRVPELYI